MTKSDLLRMCEFDEGTFERVREIANRRGPGEIGQLDREWLHTILDDYLKTRPLIAALVDVAETANQLMSSLAEFEGMDESYSSEYFQALDDALARLEKLKASRGE